MEKIKQITNAPEDEHNFLKGVMYDIDTANLGEGLPYNLNLLNDEVKAKYEQTEYPFLKTVSNDLSSISYGEGINSNLHDLKSKITSRIGVLYLEMIE